MSSIDREEEIKRSLKEDIYTHLNRLESLEDDTFASTKRLANILEGYVTKVDDLTVEEENKVLEILEELEVNIEASDDRILTEYNAKFHEKGLDTLGQILDVPQISDMEDKTVDIERESTVTMMKIEHDNVDDHVHTFDEIAEPVKIIATEDEIEPVNIKNNNDDDAEEKNQELLKDEAQLSEKRNKEKDGSLGFVDYFLIIIVVILVLIIGFIFLGGA